MGAFDLRERSQGSRQLYPWIPGTRGLVVAAESKTSERVASQRGGNRSDLGVYDYARRSQVPIPGLWIDVVAGLRPPVKNHFSEAPELVHLKHVRRARLSLRS